jgi:hypothetical protein
MDAAGIEDDFLVRVYRDDKGKPGDFVGQSYVAIGGEPPAPLLYKQHLEVGQTNFSNVWVPDFTRTDLFAYQMVLADPIPIIDIGECHWIEISNNLPSAEDDPPNTCFWWWSRNGTYDPGDPGDYSFTGTHDFEGNGVYEAFGERHFNQLFCVDVRMDQCAAGEERPQRACCSCPEDDPPSTCTLEGLSACMSDSEWTYAAQTCVDFACPDEEPVNDMCPNATIAQPETGHAFSITYNTICAHTDGPDGRDRPWQIRAEDGSMADFGREVWYKYVSTCTGFLQISTCGVGSNYDNFIGVFANGTNPKSCNGCPEDGDKFTQVAGSDESCNSLHDGGAGFVSMTVNKGNCYLIAAGGWTEDGGPGKVDIECQPVECEIAEPPVKTQKLVDRGFGCRNRYLGFAVKKERKRLQAIRVTLVDVKDPGSPHEICEGQQKWVGPPRQVTELSGETGDLPPPTHWYARCRTRSTMTTGTTTTGASTCTTSRSSRTRSTTSMRST